MILGGDITSALTSFAGLGLALILERDGAGRVRLGWSDAAEPRLVVSAEGYDDEAIAAAVHRHAVAGAAPGSWIQADLEDKPWLDKKGIPAAAVMSPRITSPSSASAWSYLQEQRHAVIDRALDDPGHGTGLELIGGLGEPAYWRFNKSKEARPDEAASRWEMKTRNRGEDFVRNRLRHLARIVAGRDVEGVRAGLTGERLVDEAYRGKRSDESRTATGLTSPRFTDSALAWCALWGLSSFPVIHRVSGASVTAGALPPGRSIPDGLVLPVLVGPHSLERWRALIASEQLIRAGLGPDGVAHRWLVAHGSRALLIFRLHRSDNSKAPEPSLGVGRVEVLA